jgi:hypothetical protein
MVGIKIDPNSPAGVKYCGIFGFILGTVLVISELLH